MIQSEMFKLSNRVLKLKDGKNYRRRWKHQNELFYKTQNIAKI